VDHPALGPPEFAADQPDSGQRSRWAWRRRGRSKTLRIAIVLAVLAGLVARGLDSTPGRATTASRLAGYTWCCSATDVSARWVVPKVLTNTTSSEAVWIGVQNGYGAHPVLFLQVGILVANTKGLPPEYFAFWSDPAIGFRPDLLQVLVPGQVVRAQLVYRKGVWHVRIRNSPSPGARLVERLAAPAGDFAEWFEEDPPFSLYGSQFAVMPDAQAVHFDDLMVNGSRPKRSRLISQGFTAQQIGYFPTPVSRADGFTVAAATTTK
jgi:hypothetical protein